MKRRPQSATVSFFVGLFFCLSPIFSACTLNPDLEAVRAQLSPYKAPDIISVSPSELFTGGETEVTITGANLGPGVSISINNKDCPISKFSGTSQVTCIAPSSAEGTFILTVSTPDDKKDQAPVTYDDLAFSKLSLVVGSLVPTSNDQDGIFNLGSCRGCSYMHYDAAGLWAPQSDSEKLRLINLETLSSAAVLQNDPSTGDITVTTTDPAAPYTEVSFAEHINNFRCFIKNNSVIYFCPSSSGLFRYDLSQPTVPPKLIAGSTYSGNDPFDSAGAYPASDPRGYGKFLQYFKAAFLYNNDIILVTSNAVFKISDHLTTAPVLTLLAGDESQYDTIDGIGSVARFYSIEEALLVGQSLYLIDAPIGEYALLRKIDLADVNSTVSTLLGSTDPADQIYGVEGPDGSGAAAYINNPSGMTLYDGKILIADDYNSLKIRIFDIASGTISTKTTIRTHFQDQMILGGLAGPARMRSYRLRSIYYIPGWGLALGTAWGLLKLN